MIEFSPYSVHIQKASLSLNVLITTWLCAGTAAARPFLAGTVPSANVMAVLNGPIKKQRLPAPAHYSTFSVASHDLLPCVLAAQRQA